MAEEDRQDSGAGNGRTLVNTTCCVIAIYFLPLLVLFVDEVVLKTNWIWRHTSSSAQDALRIMYKPVIELIQYALKR